MVFGQAQQKLSNTLMNTKRCYAEDEYTTSEDGQVLRVPHGVGASGRGAETDETTGPAEGETGRQTGQYTIW